MYKKRIYENYILKVSDLFKVVFLVGARQVGKSTLLEHLFPNVKSFVFDPVQDLYNVKKDPDLFLENFLPPLILDEIQFAPELLPSIKRKVDKLKKNGQYFLTGSQQLSILKNVSESLAGRVSIIPIDPMIPQERWVNFKGEYNWLESYLKEPDNISKNIKGLVEGLPSLFEVIWYGGMPGTIDMPQDIISNYFSSYIQTYVDRDIRTLDNIKNLTDFGNFFGLLAALTSQEINYSQLGREIGLSVSTAQRWLQLLVHTYQWNQVQPYHGNTIKRISGKPKGYFSDTGMGCYLQNISTPMALARNPMLGAFFETMCFNMINVFISVIRFKPNIYHWRTSAGAEVDLILELDNKLYPIEFKCKSSVNLHDTRGIRALKETYPNKEVAHGLVVYAGRECYKLNEYATALPWNSKI